MEEEKREPEAFRAASLAVRDENGEEVTLYILEETRLNGCSYILAVDSEEADEEEAGYMLEIFQTILEDEGADIDLLDE